MRTGGGQCYERITSGHEMPTVFRAYCGVTVKQSEWIGSATPIESMARNSTSKRPLPQSK